MMPRISMKFYNFCDKLTSGGKNFILKSVFSTIFRPLYLPCCNNHAAFEFLQYENNAVEYHLRLLLSSLICSRSLREIFSLF